MDIISEHSDKTSMVTVAVHSGRANADDMMVSAVMQLWAWHWGRILVVVRSRDPKVLEKADMRFDVGGKYDPLTHDYDHHQREGRPDPRPNGVPYSAAGLAWKHFGLCLCGNDEAIHARVDEKIFQSIDALDNGVGTTRIGLGEAEHCTLTEVLDGFNATFEETMLSQDNCFDEGAVYARRALSRAIAQARAHVRLAPTVSMEIAKHGTRGAHDALDLTAYGGLNGWGVSEQLIPTTYSLFVFRDLDGDYMVQTVPPSADKPFEQKVPFPAAWAGLREGALATLSGLPSAIFVHQAKFIGGCREREDALKMAQAVLDVHAKVG